MSTFVGKPQFFKVAKRVAMQFHKPKWIYFRLIFFCIYEVQYNKLTSGERSGSVVEHPTPEREVGGSKPTSAELCP